MTTSADRFVRLFLLVSIGISFLGCPKSLPNDPNAHVPYKMRVEWKNWSRNLVHKPSLSGAYNYFTPTNKDELKQVLAWAKAMQVEVRVTGQRHSQPPLVAEDNRQAQPYAAKTWLIDLSCYADLGAGGKQQVVLDAVNKKVTVNAGVREDYLDGFLAANNLILESATAGGFFSMGGVTAVDVHGATTRAPIMAELVSKFTIMGHDGNEITIDATSPAVTGWNAIQFARVSLGALGVVTSVTVDVLDRPYATTLASGRESHTLASEAAFVAKFTEILQHDRVESFYVPYTGEFLVLWWDLDPSPDDPEPNPEENEVASSCTHAQEVLFGAPYEDPGIEWLAQGSESWLQLFGTRDQAVMANGVASVGVQTRFDRSACDHKAHWLTEAGRVAFMSYFVELPNLDAAGLQKVWQSLQVVKARVESVDEFRMVAPLEFRFVKGGDSALAGTYTSNSAATFVNLDLIAFVPEKKSSAYEAPILRFFAHVEEKWYGDFGGLPHNGKMYGFHDPATPGSAGAPFSPAYLNHLAARRGGRLTSFEDYRKLRDPGGLFCNDFLRALSLCTGTGSP